MDMTIEYVGMVITVAALAVSGLAWLVSQIVGMRRELSSRISAADEKTREWVRELFATAERVGRVEERLGNLDERLGHVEDKLAAVKSDTSAILTIISRASG